MDKYELAHKLAAATLHLHDTPWLPDTWRLHGITALRCDEPFEVIQTLSIAMQLSFDMKPATAMSQRDLDDYFSAGVQNATLFNLGVALLEVEHGISLEAFKSRNKLESKSKSSWFASLAMADSVGRQIRSSLEAEVDVILPEVLDVASDALSDAQEATTSLGKTRLAQFFRNHGAC